MGIASTFDKDCLAVDDSCNLEGDVNWNYYSRNGYTDPVVITDKCTHNAVYNEDTTQKDICSGRTDVANCHVDAECRKVNTMGDDCNGSIGNAILTDTTTY